MIKPSSITYKEKILLYLDRFKGLESDGDKERPEGITQKGIEENLDISRTHVSRIVKKLTEEGALKEKRAPVKGHQKRLKTYYLTSKGFKKIEELLSDLSQVKVKIIDNGEEKVCALSRIEKKTDGGIDILRAISFLEDSEDLTIDLEELGPREFVRSIRDVPEVEELYGREEELRKMRNWIEGGTPFMALLGGRGHGATSLASKFISDLERKHILWVDLKKLSLKDLKERLSSFLEKIKSAEGKSKDEKSENSQDIISPFLYKEALLVFDDYHEVDDEVVYFLTRLLEKFEASEDSFSLKVMITGREGTPFYKRFYLHEHIEKKLVKELNISPLDQEDAQKILGDEIEQEALDRIMMFTKGSPLLLKLLRRGEEKKLCEITPWEKEQISLLMFLKTKVKE